MRESRDVASLAPGPPSADEIRELVGGIVDATLATGAPAPPSSDRPGARAGGRDRHPPRAPGHPAPGAGATTGGQVASRSAPTTAATP